jgi:hypothetical protein
MKPEISTSYRPSRRDLDHKCRRHDRARLSPKAFDQRHRQFASAQGEVPLVRITHVVEENDLPAIDLEVFFNFDSAEITPRLCQS